jgi:hypothetical protein
MKLEQILKTPGWKKSPKFVDLSYGSERPWYVYRHCSKTTDKSYIGVSDNPVRRWKEHVSHALRIGACGYDTKFKRAIRKYGSYDFVHEVLASSSDQESAKTLEVVCVGEYKSYTSGYNCTFGGDGASCGEKLTEEFIDVRVIEYFETNLRWPKKDHGMVIGGHHGDTWCAYDRSLFYGYRGLNGGSSLVDFLERRFGVRNRMNNRNLTEELICDLSVSFFNENGEWPSIRSGAVRGGSNGDTWKGYDRCLSHGLRGMAGGSTLADLLERKFGVNNSGNKPSLSFEFIKERSMAYLYKNGRFPTSRSGVVDGGNWCDTWCAYNRALSDGYRGLPGGSSLAKFIATLKMHNG